MGGREGRVIEWHARPVAGCCRQEGCAAPERTSQRLRAGFATLSPQGLTRGTPRAANEIPATGMQARPGPARQTPHLQPPSAPLAKIAARTAGQSVALLPGGKGRCALPGMQATDRARQAALHSRATVVGILCGCNNES